MKLNELNNQVGNVIERVEAKLVALYPAKEGKGRTGSWRVQNGTLEDDDGNKFKVSFWNRPEIEQAKGRLIVIRSKKKGNGELSGVSVEQKDQAYPPSLTVDKSAVVLPKDEETEEQPKTVQQELAKSANFQTTHKSESLEDLASLYKECLVHAAGVAKEEIREVATTLFIEARRAGIKPTVARPVSQHEHGEDSCEENEPF